MMGHDGSWFFGWGMGGFGFLVLIIIVLAIAGLAKYLFTKDGK